MQGMRTGPSALELQVQGSRTGVPTKDEPMRPTPSGGTRRALNAQANGSPDPRRVEQSSSSGLERHQRSGTRSISQQPASPYLTSLANGSHGQELIGGRRISSSSALGSGSGLSAAGGMGAADRSKGIAAGASAAVQEAHQRLERLLGPEPRSQQPQQVGAPGPGPGSGPLKRPISAPIASGAFAGNGSASPGTAGFTSLGHGGTGNGLKPRPASANMLYSSKGSAGMSAASTSLGGAFLLSTAPAALCGPGSLGSRVLGRSLSVSDGPALMSAMGVGVSNGSRSSSAVAGCGSSSSSKAGSRNALQGRNGGVSHAHGATAASEPHATGPVTSKSRSDSGREPMKDLNGGASMTSLQYNVSSVPGEACVVFASRPQLSSAPLLGTSISEKVLGSGSTNPHGLAGRYSRAGTGTASGGTSEPNSTSGQHASLGVFKQHFERRRMKSTEQLSVGVGETGKSTSIGPRTTTADLTGFSPPLAIVMEGSEGRLARRRSESSNGTSSSKFTDGHRGHHAGPRSPTTPSPKGSAAAADPKASLTGQTTPAGSSGGRTTAKAGKAIGSVAGASRPTSAGSGRAKTTGDHGKSNGGAGRAAAGRPDADSSVGTQPSQSVAGDTSPAMQAGGKGLPGPGGKEHGRRSEVRKKNTVSTGAGARRRASTGSGSSAAATPSPSAESTVPTVVNIVREAADTAAQSDAGCPSSAAVGLNARGQVPSRPKVLSIDLSVLSSSTDQHTPVSLRPSTSSSFHTTGLEKIGRIPGCSNIISSSSSSLPGLNDAPLVRALPSKVPPLTLTPITEPQPGTPTSWVSGRAADNVPLLLLPTRSPMQSPRSVLGISRRIRGSSSSSSNGLPPRCGWPRNPPLQDGSDMVMAPSAVVMHDLAVSSHGLLALFGADSNAFIDALRERYMEVINTNRRMA